MNCHNCKNPIQDNSKECEWCGCEIINKDNSDKIGHINSVSDLDTIILELCKKGQRLEAIKLKIDNSDLNVKESKKYVEDLMANNGLKNSGCFVATACYGDYECEEVKEFRIYRDNVMLKSSLGRLFVSTYYFISPPIANLISKSEISKRIIRTVFLNNILNLIRKQ